MHLGICIAMLTLCSAASDTPKEWSNWISEGKVLTRTGNPAAAAQAFRQALALAEKANTDERTLVEICDALASVYAQAGQYAESEHQFRRALALTEKKQGRQSLEYALLIAGMAVLPTQIGNRKIFVKILREAITVNRETALVRELAIVQASLAQMLMDGRKYTEAESVLLDAQFNAARLRTTNPELLAELLNGLGVLRFNQRRYRESVDLYLESLRLLEGVTGNAHPSLVAPLNNLALSFLKLGQLSEAEINLRQASLVCGKTLGEDHPTCGAILDGYAAVLRKLNRKREAKAVTAQSQQIARDARRRNGVGLTISVTGLR